jgi:hypothetical protein
MSNEQHVYPYQDKKTDLLEGEIWRDVPALEVYYQVSNLGRVRSLDRVVPHPRLHSQFVKGRILSQSIAKNKNILSGIPMIDLRVSLSYSGKMQYHNTRRLVYTTFVRPLDFEKDGLYVINDDCDGYNCRLDNLSVSTKSEKSRRAFHRERVPESYLKTADRSKWKGKIYGGMSRRKPILQLDLNNNIIAHFESISQASRSTGIGEKEIINVAKGRYAQWKGFRWKYVDN